LNIQKYFNSGVLLIDIKKWNSHLILEQLTKEIEENIVSGINLPCPDQDVLNMVLHNHVLFIEQKYNLPYRLVQPSLIKPKIINSDPMKASLVHFIGAIKPWTTYNQSVPIVKVWAAAKADSPWADKLLHGPQSQKAFHQAARDWRRQRKWIPMIQAYGRFFQSKLDGTPKNGY
jgi:lipopolysaccharide biosynthesis glycosyltransferase